jgi:predicted DNA-binding transcriptional regulator AlpA
MNPIITDTDNTSVQIPFVSLAQVTKQLGCSKRLIYNQIKSGRLKPKYLGKRIFFRVEDITNAFSDKSNVIKK